MLEISCPTPTAIGNGQFTLSDGWCGSKVSYSCNTGYNLDIFERECGEDGNWDKSDPTCESKFYYSRLVTLCLKE